MMTSDKHKWRLVAFLGTRIAFTVMVLLTALTGKVYVPLLLIYWIPSMIMNYLYVFEVNNGAK